MSQGLARSLLFVIVLMGTAASAIASESPVTTVTVQGEAVIEGVDLPQARRRALQEAFNAALTRVMGAYITADSYTRNFESIERNLYARTEGYIKTYEVVDELPAEGLLELTVRVDVSTAPLKDDLTALGILLDAVGNPLTSVTGEEEGLEIPVTPSRFQEQLVQQGFRAQSGAALSPDLLIELTGRQRNLSEVGGLGMYSAVVSLEAVASWQPDGRTVATIIETANGAGLYPEAALQEAYTQAADAVFPLLLERVIMAWQVERCTGRLVPVEVTAAEMSDLLGFKRQLGRVFGVDQVELKGFDAGYGHLLVRFHGHATQLAELIDMRDFPQQRVRVVSVDNSSLSVSVVSHQ